MILQMICKVMTILELLNICNIHNLVILEVGLFLLLWINCIIYIGQMDSLSEILVFKQMFNGKQVNPLMLDSMSQMLMNYMILHIMDSIQMVLM